MKTLFKRSATRAIKRRGAKIVPASSGTSDLNPLEDLKILGNIAEMMSIKIKKAEKEHSRICAFASAQTDAEERNEVMGRAALLLHKITHLKRHLSRLYLHISDVMLTLQMKSASKNMRERSFRTQKAAASDFEKLRKLR